MSVQLSRAVLPRAYVAFSEPSTRVTPGRMRLRIPEKRGDDDFFKQLSAQVRMLDGILDVTVRAKTGSLLILHDRHEDELLVSLHTLKQARIVRREDFPLEARLGWRPLSEKELATLKTAAFLVLSGIQLFRGKALGASTSLFGQAMEYWRQMYGSTERSITEKK